ncbi:MULTISPECIES: PAS domain S-box protein [unclassified Sphingomonas]|uniref:PAS domain S-box protein n=1 Tax=unclassified Sphingomonas TaxID=196159 RepID=UPI002269C26C|nr:MULTISPECIES: PAS domain S-box protein [unclassified Sphingomonas]
MLSGPGQDLAADHDLSGRQARLIIASAIDYAIVGTDRAGTITSWNVGAERIMGWSAPEAIGRSATMFFTPEDVTAGVPEAEMNAAIQTGRGTDERWHLKKDGIRFWANGEIMPLLEEGGALEGFVKILRDRTAQHQAAVAACEVEDGVQTRRSAMLRLGECLRDLDDPTAMADMAAEIVGQALGVTASGYGQIDAADEVLSVERDWTSKPGFSFVAQHPMRNYGSYIDELHANRVVAITDAWTDSRTADQRAVFEAISIRSLINAPVVERGRLTAILCILSERAREWTTAELEFVQRVAEQTRVAIERRRAEQAVHVLAGTLQEQVEARTKERDRIWQVSRDLLGVADDQGIWLSINPAWTNALGWPPEAIVGKTSEWLEHPDDRTKTRAEVCRLAQGESTLFFENRFRTKDGGYRDLSWSAVPVEGLLYCVARDVTEQKEREAALSVAEDQLRQSQKVEAVGQLTGGVAHDFNNLLTVIRGSLDLLRRPGLSEEKRKRYMAAISDTTDRATKLTSQLLAFARRQALKPEVFDAGESIASLRDMLGTLTGSRITVGLDVPDGAFLIRADRSQFDNALVNMAVNARDAMNGEGALTISVREASGIPAVRSHPKVPGRFVAVAVVDTGAGIAADQLDRIFEPFYTTKGVGHGTGLGLSQVFGFAKQSSGEVIVRSVAGEGATFTLYLPKAHQEAERSVAHIVGSVAPLAKGACILVVEDNVEVGSFATQALAELGYRTTLAVDAASALAELGDDGAGFDMVFSDVVMPGMSGIELAEEVGRRLPSLPIVLTSGYSSVLAEQDSHSFQLLQKPYSLDELADALARASAEV